MLNHDFHQVATSKLIIKVCTKGAEVCSVKDKSTGYEFIWQADPKVWSRHAPVLFPIVGRLNQNRLLVNGNHFEMGQHGFARDLNFEMVELYTNMMRFMLSANEQTKAMFPYDFRLFITYEAFDENLTVSYTIVNTGTARLYYSIGAHPAFNLPGKRLADCVIEFEKEEDLSRHLLSNGLFNGDTENLGTHTRQLKLDAALFSKDAIVLKNLNSHYLALVQPGTDFKIGVHFNGFPYMGIWTKYPHETFLCLEPWLGLSDSDYFNDDISVKEGILTLAPQKEATFSYTISFQAP